MRWIKAIWPEVRYWVVGVLFWLKWLDWYHPFSPLDCERAVSDKAKPLLFG